MVPSRDEVASYRSQRNSKGDVKTPSKGGGGGGGAGAGLLARLMIAVCLIVAASAVAWAYQLQKDAQEAALVRADYEARISDLEDRLSDTDESVNQSGVAMQVKIKELYSEVDKLWASAWRKNKAKIAANEKAVAETSKQVKSQNTAIDSIKSQSRTTDIQISALSGQLDEVSDMLIPMRKLLDSASSDRRQMERLADNVHKLKQDYGALQKRVGTGEEDIAAINGFRRQVWSTLNEMQQVLAQIQSGEPPIINP
jgi:chromosome segregation ATPase